MNVDVEARKWMLRVVARVRRSTGVAVRWKGTTADWGRR